MSVAHVLPVGQSESARHSTQVWVDVSQAVVHPPVQSELDVQVAPQVCVLEQEGVSVEQSLLDKQSTHELVAVLQTWP